MKFIFYLVALAFTTKVEFNKCSCPEALTKEHCREEGVDNCEWNDGKCEVTPKPGCIEYSGKYQCISDANCAWELGKSSTYSCVDFSSCSKSKANSQTACREYSSGCTYYGGDSCDAYVNPPCKEKDQASCQADFNCFYSKIDNKCIEFVACSEANTLTDLPAIQQACQARPSSCIYQQNKCQDRTSCGQYKADECQLIVDIKFTTATLCKVIDGACKEYDAKTLTEENCWTDSQQSYNWNGKSCQQCKGSYGLIIGIIVMVIL